MPVNRKYLETIKPCCSYHVYNRTNNKENLFTDENDRIFFLERLKLYLQDYLNINAYCLLDNHFHLLVTPKSDDCIRRYLSSKRMNELTQIHKSYLASEYDEEKYNALIIQQFSRFFISYSLCFNKDKLRKGNLFHRPFKRVLVDNEEYFRKLVLYIHQNPVKHLITLEYENYLWSSYRSYATPVLGIISKEKVINSFGSLSKFKLAHKRKTDFKEIFELLLESK